MTIKSVLHIEDILTWADAHRKRTGEWPTAESGPVFETPDEKWSAIDSALRAGHRGLRRGNSLARLLRKHRGRRNRKDLPHYSEGEILRWADAHQRRTGEWPNSESGPIAGSPGETWGAVEAALQIGGRGLPGSSSIAKLLAKSRRTRNRTNIPQLSLSRILVWADAHRRYTGDWPTAHSGSVHAVPGETWVAVDLALKRGRRGLRTRTSLRQLLARHRGVTKHVRHVQLTTEKVLQWADRHFAKTGRWPTAASGMVAGRPEDTWKKIDVALRTGWRGFEGGSSLAKLLAAERNVRGNMTEQTVLSWADAFHKKYGTWPNTTSGKIDGKSGESWKSVDGALRNGRRGLPGGSSLTQLLESQRGMRNCNAPPRLSQEQILEWADQFYAKHGTWPTKHSGAVAEAPAEKWSTIDAALRRGLRGLQRNSSLPRLLFQHRQVRSGQVAPQLTIELILNWATDHLQHVGRLPTSYSGKVAQSPEEYWQRINDALARGLRGLPGGSSLSKLFKEYGLR